MMMNDPVLPADDQAQFRSLVARVAALERSARLQPVAMPSAIIGGADAGFGFRSTSTTTYTEMFRVDGYVTATTLDYDIQTSAAFATTAPTSVEWKIEALAFGVTPDTILASGTSAAGEQASAFVDLLALFGEQVIGQFLSFRVSVKHTGGTGEAAAVRLVKPLLLRIQGS